MSSQYEKTPVASRDFDVDLRVAYETAPSSCLR